jgi:hypothetical protein
MKIKVDVVPYSNQTEQSILFDLTKSQNESTICKKSFAFKAAPPIKPPSTSGLENSSRAFAGLQLPP